MLLFVFNIILLGFIYFFAFDKFIYNYFIAIKDLYFEVHRFTAALCDEMNFCGDK